MLDLLLNRGTVRTGDIVDALPRGHAVAALSHGGEPTAQILRLDLSETGLDGDALRALGASPRVRALEYLCLSRNPAIGEAADDALGAMLVALPSLTALHVQRCSLSGAASASIGASLSSGAHAALAELKLDDNPGLLAPPAFIHSGFCTRVDYEHAHSSPIASHVHVRSFTEGIAACTALRKLSLGSCDLSDAHVDAMCRAVESGAAPSALTELDVRQNALTASGASELLRVHSSLKRIAFFGQPAIGRSLSEGVAATGGGDGGGAAPLIEALATSGALTSLDMGACDLGVEAIRTLCDGLTNGVAAQLRTLELFGNGTDVATRDAWKEALQSLKEARPQLDVAWTEPQGEAPAAAEPES